VTKTADNTVSKVGDTVRFMVSVQNTGDVSLNLVSFTDTLQGNIAGHFTSPLAAGATQSYSYDYVVPPGAPDPLVNTATAHYGITGLPNDITASASATVDLVHPLIKVTKTADNTVSKVGDTVRFTVSVQNTGDVSLNLVSFTDTLQGNIAGHFISPLAAGATQSYSYDYVVPPGAPDPLVNTATAHYGITGLPNDITASASATVDLVHPLIKVTKTADNTSARWGTRCASRCRCRTPGMCP